MTVTKKFLNNYVAGGYTLANHTNLYITGSGGVGGTGISAQYNSTITNDGRVDATALFDGARDPGIIFGSGGSLINGSSTYTNALVEGGDAGVFGTGAGALAVTNFGVIEAVNSVYGQGDGIELAVGGSVTNGSANDRGALVEGAVGVYVVNAAGTVANLGAIVGSAKQGVALSSGGNVTNGAVTDTAASIDGVGQGVSLLLAGTVTNLGTIFASGAAHGDEGIQIAGGWRLANGAAGSTAATIYGYSGALVSGGIGAVANYGTIKGLGASAEFGVELSGGGAVTNGGAGDLTACIAGGAGVVVSGATGSVANFGAIVGTVNQGVVLFAGGNVTNGAVTDTTASISGVHQGVGVVQFCTVSNFGAISGTGAASGDTGVEMNSGGRLVNGGAGDPVAAISGYTGVLLAAAGLVLNYGAIRGLGAANTQSGVDLAAGGGVANGSGTDRTASIEGAYTGVAVGAAPGYLTNFGTILGDQGFAVLLSAGGSVTNGALNISTAVVQGASGLYMAGGSATNFGVISGVGAFSGGAVGLGVDLYDGAAITNGAAGHTGALIEGYKGVYAQQLITVTNFGTIEGDGSDAVYFRPDLGDVLVVEAGSTFIGAVLGGGGTLDLASGTGAISKFANGTLTVTGSMAATTFQTFGTVEVGAGATFTDRSAVTIAAGQTVSDAGTLTLGGAAKNSVVNSGIIETTGAGVLTLAGTTANTGTIAADGGAITVSKALSGPGVLAVAGGTLTVTGAVTGTGSATINGGTLDFASSFKESVTFTGTTGVLELAQSQTYTGSVTGFSKTSGTSLDLVDIGFVSSTEATFSGTTASGVLTVTDGTHTAHITLRGNYTASTFVASSDGHGGTTVVDPRARASIAPAHRLIAAMAGMGAGVGVSVHETVPTRPTVGFMLARPA